MATRAGEQVALTGEFEVPLPLRFDRCASEFRVQRHQPPAQEVEAQPTSVFDIGERTGAAFERQYCLVLDDIQTEREHSAPIPMADKDVDDPVVLFDFLLEARERVGAGDLRRVRKLDDRGDFFRTQRRPAGSRGDRRCRRRETDRRERNC